LVVAGYLGSLGLRKIVEQVAYLFQAIVVQVVVGWPVLALASLMFVVFLRFRLRWLAVVGSLTLALAFSVLVAILFARFLPLRLFPGPMLGRFINLPAVLACVLVFPIVGVWFKLPIIRSAA
jgi:hypothetical protein